MREQILEKLIEALMGMPEVSEETPAGADGLAVEKTEVKALEDGEEMPLELGADDEEMDPKKKALLALAK